MKAAKVSIKIDKELNDKIVLYLKDDRNLSMNVEQFVEYILKEIMNILKEDLAVIPNEGKELKERLRGLGYL